MSHSVESVSSNSAPVKGIVFDMDGLIMDSETLAMRSLETAGAALGYDMPEEFCRKMIGVPADQCRILTTQTYGEDFPLEKFFDTHEVHLREAVDAGKLELKTGVLELLDYLDKHHIPRAIATSSSRYRAEHHLELVNLKDRFDYVVTRDDVTIGKPNPEPYLKAVELLKIPAENVLALEDSHNGVRAGHAAKLRVIMIPDLLGPNDEMREITTNIYETLHQVIEYIDQVNNSQSVSS